MRQSKRFRFPNGRGESLAAIAEIPAGSVWTWAVFSHCFTCTKDLKAIVRVSRRLAEHGIGVFRYDGTGLGESEGDFGRTNFSTTCQDLLAAAQFASAELGQVRLLVGHSFGGAASLACAKKIDSIQAVATLAAPSDTQHLAEHIDRQNPRIQTEGEGDFSVGGQTYRLRRQLLDDLRGFDFTSHLARMNLPLLIFHSPIDETLARQHALNILASVPGPASLVTLDGADHLLVNQPSDVTFVGDLTAAWLSRYVSRKES